MTVDLPVFAVGRDKITFFALTSPYCRQILMIFQEFCSAGLASPNGAVNMKVDGGYLRLAGSQDHFPFPRVGMVRVRIFHIMDE